MVKIVETVKIVEIVEIEEIEEIEEIVEIVETVETVETVKPWKSSSPEVGGCKFQVPRSQFIAKNEWFTLLTGYCVPVTAH